jgi:hypothetical protein
MVRTVLIASLLCISQWNTQAQTNNTFFLGHSLTNFHIPNMVNQLSIEAGQMFSYDANIGIGANLAWHWQSPTSGQGAQWDLTLPNGGYENFIITEAVPLNNHLQYSNTYRYVDSLYQFAELYNPNIRYYIYETWHCTNSGNGTTTGAGGYPCSYDPESNTLWRDRLDLDLEKWESIADSINLIHPNEMYVIPGGQAFARLTDSIETGNVPGLNSVYDLFEDEYHLDPRGNYFIACVMYSVIHGISPVGLPNQLMTEFGGLYTEYPTVEQAEIMQEIAWQTVCEYQRDGVDCGPLSISESKIPMETINVFPVPANDHITIEYNSMSENLQFSITDQLGKELVKGRLNSQKTVVPVSELPQGLYFLEIDNKSVKFSK